MMRSEKKGNKGGGRIESNGKTERLQQNFRTNRKWGGCRARSSIRRILGTVGKDGEEISKIKSVLGLEEGRR